MSSLSGPAISICSKVRLSSGHLMPLIGLGVYQNYDTAASCVQAFQAGYRHVDSAQAYKNEAHVGEAIRLSNIPRDELFITSKCISKTHGYESTLRGVDASLQKFGLEYLDLFLIHDPYSGKARRLETYRALVECKAKGKLHSIGVSNYGVKHLEEIRESGLEMPSVNQIELHPFCQQQPIVSYCREHSIFVQAYSPLIRAMRMDNPALKDVAQKHNRDAAQILLRWSLQRGFSPLPKSANPERIRSNIQLYDFELDGDDMTKINELDQRKDGAVTWNPVDVE